MMSSGCEPKIHLRGVTPHTLLHGGLGHRPPPYEELILFGSYLGVLDLSLWESAQIWPFVSILAFLGKLSLSGFEFYPKPQPYPKPHSFSNTFYFMLSAKLMVGTGDKYFLRLHLGP